MKRIITLLATILIGFSQMMADPTAQTIPGSLDLSNGTYTGTGSYNAETEAMDGFKNGGTGTFVLNNATAQAYKISFDAATTRGDVSLEFKITNGEDVVCQQTATVANTGKWTDYQTFKCFTPELPVSDHLTLVITMKSSGSNWTANVKNVVFSVKVPGEDDVVNQIPTDDDHPFVLTGAKVEGSGTVKTDVENGAFDSFKNGATATVLIDCVEAGAYKIAFLAASKTAGATLRFSFFKEGEDEAELEKEIAVQSETNWAWYEVKDDLGDLTVGKKTLVITFIAAEGETWTANMKDVKIAFSTEKIVNQIPTDADHPFVLTDAEIEGNGTVKKDVENGRFDSFYNGAKALIAINNTMEQYYSVSFEAATNQSGNPGLKFYIKDGETVVDESEAITIDKNGWNNYKQYFWHTTNKIPTGTYTFVVEFLRDVNGTTVNAKNFAFKALENVALTESESYTPVAKYANVTLTRSIAADKWSTICLPFDMTAEQVTAAFGADANLATLTSGDASALTFETVESIEANKPYAIKVATAFTSATIDAVDIKMATPTQSVTNWDFVGNYTKDTAIPANAYFFNGGKIVKAGDDSNKIQPFRGYFMGNASAPGLSFILDGQTTGVNEVRGKMADVRNEVYNLAGQRVAQPAKGLYIVNGKKIIK